MVNTTGGKQHKRAKKHREPINSNDNQIEYADANQVYALVKSKAGGSRLLVECSDNKQRSAMIPGKFFKKLWFNPGDILLCSLNMGGDDSFCHIEHKYSIRDANTLKFQGKITFDVIGNKEENKGFKFTDKKNNNVIPDQVDSDEDSSESLGEFSNPNRPIKQRKNSESKSE